MGTSIKKMIIDEVTSALTELQVGDPNRTEAWLMNVPNDNLGKKKIGAIKLLFGADYLIKLRGRHSNRKEVLGAKYQPGAQNDIPVSQAEYIGVYLYPKPQAVAEPDSPEGDEQGDSTFNEPGANRNLSHPHPLSELVPKGKTGLEHSPMLINRKAQDFFKKYKNDITAVDVSQNDDAAESDMFNSIEWDLYEFLGVTKEQSVRNAKIGQIIDDIVKVLVEMARSGNSSTAVKEEFDIWTCMECHYQSSKRFTRCPKCSSQEIENLG